MFGHECLCASCRVEDCTYKVSESGHCSWDSWLRTNKNPCRFPSRCCLEDSIGVPCAMGPWGRWPAHTSGFSTDQWAVIAGEAREDTAPGGTSRTSRRALGAGGGRERRTKTRRRTCLFWLATTTEGTREYI